MPDLKLGLAPGKRGFFDPLTNLNLSMSKPVDTVTYTEADSLKNIAHAVLASKPALTLYQGTLPQETVDAWKSKFDKMFYTPTTRQIVKDGKVIGTEQIKKTIHPGFPGQAADLEGNRAYDRADSQETEVVGANVGEVEVVALDTEDQAEAEVQEAETQEAETQEAETQEAEVQAAEEAPEAEVATKKAPAKKGSRSTKNN